MAITAKTLVTGYTEAELEAAIAAAIDLGAYPVGDIFQRNGQLYQAMQEGAASATFEDLDDRTTAAEAAIDALELLDTTVSYSANGAIAVTATGATIVFLTKAGVGAYTMAAPAAAGIIRRIISTTANAHVITATNLLDNGTDAGGIKDTATFAAFPGASITVVSTPDLHWAVLSVVAVTVA